MTAKEAAELDSVGPIEEIPQEAKEIDIRHLAIGTSMTTLCGLERGGLLTAHPSKTRRTDCLACREALRAGKSSGKNEPPPPPFKTGDYIEYPDGSAWEVEWINESGMAIKCVVASPSHDKGRKTVVSPHAALRIFTTEEFVALVRATDTTRVSTTTTTASKPSGSRWAPTVADVAEVKRLRALGTSYIAIETAMGWPRGHGNRPWRIVTGKLTAKK
jgi:hypothetical protein